MGLSIGHVVSIEGLVNDPWDRGDLGLKLLLNLVKIKAILISDQVDSNTKMAKTAGSSNSVQIGFSTFGEIKIDDNIDRWDINTTSKEI